MKFKPDERGFVLAEFAIALPLLIFLLYSLGMVTVNGLKIAREQVADYVLETEAQYVIDRITTDARAAHSVQIKDANDFDEIIFICHSNRSDGNDSRFYDIFTQRIYRIDSGTDNSFHVYFKHKDDERHPTPLIGNSIFGNHIVTAFETDRDKLERKIFHITFEMRSRVTPQKVKFATSVYMPACKKIICHGETILDEG